MRKFSRREFTRLLAAGTAGGFVPFWNPLNALAETSSDGMPREYDCIILGAGMSGITAARSLASRTLAHRPIRLLVLEGSSRIGGRIHTRYDFAEGPIEVGAEYIHRRRGSVPLWNDVEAFGLETTVIPKLSKGLIYHESWDKFRRPRTLYVRWSILKSFRLFRDINSYEGPDMSAAEWIRFVGNRTAMDYDVMSLALTGHLPASLDELSIRGFRSDRISEQLTEPNDFQLVQGFSKLVELMSAGINIEKEKKVRGIVTNDGRVTVETDDGSIYRARAAICTFSLGMLKSREVEFSPELPEEKLEAFEGITMGPVSKVIIQFRDKFWPPDMSMCHHIDPSRSGGRTYFHDLYRTDSPSNVLTAFFVGPDAERIKDLELEELLRRICGDLDKMFSPDPPSFDQISKNPDDSPSVIVKPWASDPFAKGGYTFLNTRSSDRAQHLRRSLARSTGPLFWAGEATSFDTQPSSVHGAHLSGLRAADEIFEYLTRGPAATGSASSRLNDLRIPSGSFRL